MNKLKAIFLTKPNATPADIKGLLVPHGLIGISVDVDDKFRELKNIYIVHEPREGMNRHPLIIVGHGRTKDIKLDNKLFFIVQNTWGTIWGINGYGRIIIEKTCPIFYVGELVK
ncbi:dipeptidyl peptidase 1 [Brassica rapa]|uniref:dipeptidyl peptidase 1 n=1 Tax=Brassica campestris TaxID=3711 RepID=UPI0004F13FD5|nr:dipeptidyl peptidase 1 [Brassica rapa]